MSIEEKLKYLDYIRKYATSKFKDFKKLSKDIDLMFEYKTINESEHDYLTGFLIGITITKIDYNIGEK